MMEPASPLGVTAEVEGGRGSVDVFYQPLARSAAQHTVHPLDMLFTYADVADRLPSFLQNWLSKEDILGPVYNLYFSTRYNSTLYQENKFLNFAQAIETYHRVTLNRCIVPKAEFRKLLRAMLKVVGRENRRWIGERLGHANEPTLRDRIGELVDKFAGGLPKLQSEKETFVASVTDTRNYYTHYAPSLKAKATHGGPELYRLAQKVSALLAVCLLHELGFSEGEMRVLVEKHRKLQYDLSF